MNQKTSYPMNYTHEGAPAARTNAYQQLRRSVLSCFLWESEFYENGQEIAERIVELVRLVPAAQVLDLAAEARHSFNLRHVPLLLLAAAAGCGKLTHEAVTTTIQRADEMAELLAIHAKLNNVKPSELKGCIPNQMKRGIAQAFGKFNAYSLAKYNRDSDIKLRDVMFLCHPRPADPVRAALYRDIASNNLAAPDTWEVALSAGADKAETFARLILGGKLGYLALLRNLRNMVQAGVDNALIQDAIIARQNGADKVLPFRYIAAARACPAMEPAIDQAMCEAIQKSPNFDGTTIILVDVSGSMDEKLSAKSDMKRIDAACGLAALIHGQRRIFSFSNTVAEVPTRMGLACVDAIQHSQPHGGTELFNAIRFVNNLRHDRLIVITDEQANGTGWRNEGCMPAPVASRAYLINVASAKHGVGYGKWTHIDGFSEGVIRYIREVEKENG